MFPRKLSERIRGAVKQLSSVRRANLYRKRVNRSDAYKAAAQQAGLSWRTGNSQEAIHHLKQVGAQAGFDFGQVPDSWWAGFLDAYMSPVDCVDEAEQSLVARTAEIDAERPITAALWLELYALCLRVGLFRVAYTLRSNAREAALNSAEGAAKRWRDEDYRLALAAALDLGLWETAEAIIVKMSRSADANRAVTAKRMLALLSGTKPPVLDLSDPENLRFHSLVNDKSVALVGPAIPTGTPGSEIDSFDLVVKINSRSGGQGCEPNTQGRRVDISYYNGEQARYMAETLGQGVPESLRAAVFKAKRHLPKGQEGTHRFRVMMRFDWLMFDGNYNTVPNAVFDLLSFGPSRIKVFNTDLMLSAGRYKGYRPQRLGEVDHARSFVTHCPVAQYNSLWHLYRSNKIEGDETFLRVMGLGPERYMAELQSVHGRKASEE